MSKNLIGFDIGGTKCAVVLGCCEDEAISIIDRVSFPTESLRGPEHALTRLEEETRILLATHRMTLDTITGIGISCGNPLDSRRGIILSPPNLPGWDAIPICDRYQERLGIPTRLQNDANACALAEWRWGAGKGCRHMIYLTFGTGFGAGLILDGRLYAGACDMAGEIGHVRIAEDGPIGYGKSGSLEGFCSGGGIARQAQTRVRLARDRGENIGFAPPNMPLENITAEVVAKAARLGDPQALEIFSTVAEQLGRALAILIDLLNPERIVIGSIFSRQRELLWPVAERVIREEALQPNANCCQILPASLGEMVGDYACLAVAADCPRRTS